MPIHLQKRLWRLLAFLVVLAGTSVWDACRERGDAKHPHALLGVWRADDPRSTAKWDIRRNGRMVVSSTKYGDSVIGTVRWYVQADSTSGKVKRTLCTVSPSGVERCIPMVLEGDTLFVGDSRLRRAR